MGVYTVLQAAIPLLVYVMALALPTIVYARRRGMR